MVINSKKITTLLVVLLTVIGLSASEYSYSIIKSLVIPGWGQIATGHKSGYINLAAEAILISSKIYSDNEADLNKEQSINYAIKYAHIGTDTYNDDYYKTIGRYASSDFEANGYNQEVLEEAAELFPGDSEAQNNYIEENQIQSNMSWKWDSKKARYKYNNLRRDYHDYQDYGTTLVGVILANHLISAVDMMIKYKRRPENSRLSFNAYLKEDYTPMLNLNVKF